MAGAVNIDLGLDDGALDASFTMGGPTRELFLSTAARSTVRCCALSVSTTTMKSRATCMKLSFAAA